jgi:hypothetical protein
MAVPDRSPRSLPDSIVAGLAGGALAGLTDAAATAAAAGPGARRLWLLLLAASLGACLGALLAAGYLALTRLLGRLPGTGRWPAAAAAVVIAAPVVLFDAFALFTGAQASRLPGRHLISALLVLVGLAGIVLAQRGFSRALEAGRAGHRRAAGVWAGGWVALACWRRWPIAWCCPPLPLVPHHADGAVSGRAGPGGRQRHDHRSVTGTSSGAAAAAVAGRCLSAGAGGRGRQHSIARSQPCLASSGAPGAGDRRGAASAGAAVCPPDPRPVLLPAGASHHPQPQTRGPTRPGADVVLITIDALRADHVGAYGYPRATTPNIDALARRAVRFERAYAQAPHTSFSIASMLTGKYYPTLAGWPPGHPRPADRSAAGGGLADRRVLPAGHLLRRRRQAAGLSAKPLPLRAREVRIRRRPHPAGRGKVVLRPGAADQAFVWVHFFEPHEPTIASPPRASAIGTSIVTTGRSPIPTRSSGNCCDYLQRTRPGAIVILAADHGEEFDDHGGRYHGSTLFDEQVRVPLIIAVPGLAPRSVPSPVELVDIAPPCSACSTCPCPRACAARISGRG